MTDNHQYETPAAGTLDWDEPLNRNFERIDTDVEIRDTDASRSNYVPKAGAKFLATDTGNVYLGDGSSWSQLGTIGGSSDGADVVSLLLAGNVVAIGKNNSTPRAIDPAGTDTPVQDALDVRGPPA